MNGIVLLDVRVLSAEDFVIWAYVVAARTSPGAF